MLRFEHLRSGTYTLEPALRPCDGNCGQLDPRAAECAFPVKKVGATSVRLRVVFRGVEPCVVTPRLTVRRHRVASAERAPR